MHTPRPLPEAILATSPLWDELDGGTLIVACSGGADSVGILRAADALLRDPVFAGRFTAPPKLIYFHYNHRLRPDNEHDEDFVQELGAALQRAGWVIVAPIRDGQAPRAGNLEAGLRRERYRALLDLIEKLRGSPEGHGPILAVTAHHLGDQAETILHHIVRGTHLSGVRGIHAVRNEVIHRPWLKLAPEEIRSYLQSLGQDWREDASNADVSFSRNRIRHQVLPELLQINPRAREHIARMAGTAELAQSCISEALAELVIERFNQHDLQRWLPLIGWQSADYFLHRSENACFMAADLLARYAWSQLRPLSGTLEDKEWRAINEWALQPQRLLHLRSWRLRLLHERVLALQGPEEALGELPRASLKEGASLRIGGLEARLQRCTAEFWQAELSRERHPWERIRDWGLSMDSLSASPPLGPAWHCALPEQVSTPLTLRAPQSGERLQLPGGGSKLLSDIFIDARVPRPFRSVWCVLADAKDQALWLPGLADSALTRIEAGQTPRWLLSLRDLSARDHDA